MKIISIENGYQFLVIKKRHSHNICNVQEVSYRKFSREAQNKTSNYNKTTIITVNMKFINTKIKVLFLQNTKLKNIQPGVKSNITKT